MKMIYNGTPVNSMNVRHYEMDTNDCTMVASDLQAGVTAVARGKKITGTGKCFEFASYGRMKANLGTYIPNNINIIEVASAEYPIKLKFELDAMKDIDFTTLQNIATVTIDGDDFDINVSVVSNILKISCDKTFYLQVFYGKDNHI